MAQGKIWYFNLLLVFSLACLLFGVSGAVSAAPAASPWIDWYALTPLQLNRTLPAEWTKRVERLLKDPNRHLIILQVAHSHHAKFRNRGTLQVKPGMEIVTFRRMAMSASFLVTQADGVNILAEYIQAFKGAALGDRGILRSELADWTPKVCWATETGASAYQLFRRMQGTRSWRLLYEGAESSYADPDLKTAWYTGAVYEYQVRHTDGQRVVTHPQICMSMIPLTWSNEARGYLRRMASPMLQDEYFHPRIRAMAAQVYNAPGDQVAFNKLYTLLDGAPEEVRPHIIDDMLLLTGGILGEYPRRWLRWWEQPPGISAHPGIERKEMLAEPTMQCYHLTYSDKLILTQEVKLPTIRDHDILKLLNIVAAQLNTPLNLEILRDKEINDGKVYIDKEYDIKEGTYTVISVLELIRILTPKINWKVDEKYGCINVLITLSDMTKDPFVFLIDNTMQLELTRSTLTDLIFKGTGYLYLRESNVEKEKSYTITIEKDMDKHQLLDAFMSLDKSRYVINVYGPPVEMKRYKVGDKTVIEGSIATITYAYCVK